MLFQISSFTNVVNLSSIHHSAQLCQSKRAPGKIRRLSFIAAQHTAVFAQTFRKKACICSLQRHRTQRSPQPLFGTSCWTLSCVCHHHYCPFLLAWTEIPTRLLRALNNYNSSEPSSWGSTPQNANSLVRKFISPARPSSIHTWDFGWSRVLPAATPLVIHP